ncbi:MAG: hypothetical protein RJA22_2179 [Verrucomicrobiota bacterium]|jgi:2-C-methyl-D-erythritol 4-phosphate cytidylyltransferase
MNSVVIVAAGRGTRMGPGVDKLFLEAAGRPVVTHTWAAFDRATDVHELILVVRDGQQAHFEELARELRPAKPWRLTPGGQERQDSVWNGLQALNPAAELVAIHDGARPCVTPALITATFAAARATGAAVAAQRVTDTIKESADGRTIAAHLDRSRLWAVQTPQAFRVEVIRRALAAVRQQGLSVTDDTAACALIQQAVQLVEAADPNPKVTVPADLPYIELLLRAAAPA